MLFGITSAGQRIDAYELRSDQLSATILTHGATLNKVHLAGFDHNLTLGSDRLADYEGEMQFFGSVVGPIANRIRGACAAIDGVTHHFEANQNKAHMLHSASAGTQVKIWRVEAHTESMITLSHQMPAGEIGLPGDRRIAATYSLLNGAIRLTIVTTSTVSSLANVTNHSFWNLDGSDHLAGHRLCINATQYLPTDNQRLPTGEIASVAGSQFDFQTWQSLEKAPSIDNTFCLGAHQASLREAMRLKGASGIEMRVFTTEPGLHLYRGRTNAHAMRPGQEGLAVECQGWPDAPNQPHFPPIHVGPNTPLRQTTEWHFTAPCAGR